MHEKSEDHIEDHTSMIREFHRADCMDIMRGMKDKSIDIAIVDPPYGIGQSGGAYANSAKGAARGFSGDIIHERKEWDDRPPSKEYFDELFRVSKNQIICGGNYFTDKIPPSRGWVVWYKNIKQKSKMHSDCELIWTSYNTRARVFVYDYVGIGYINGKQTHGEKIHPTGKPFPLYQYLLREFAESGDIIFDSHVGGASSLIACESMGYDYIGCEIDQDYYTAAENRLKEYRMQGVLNL